MPMDNAVNDLIALAFNGVMPIKATLLRPLAFPRLVGVARRDGESIVFRCMNIDSKGLDAESSVGFEFANVRTAEQLLAFVAKHGPLLPLPPGLVLSEGTARGFTELKPPINVRESVNELLAEAAELSALLHASLDARRAEAGDDQAGRRLTRFCETRHLDDWAVGEGLESRALLVSHHCAGAFAEHLRGARAFVQVAGSGRFEIRLVADSLLGSCYVNVARALAEKLPIAVCKGCERVFVVGDSRQAFCEPRCAGRQRAKRFQEKKPKSSKGAPDGKTTRTR